MESAQARFQLILALLKTYHGLEYFNYSQEIIIGKGINLRPNKPKVLAFVMSYVSLKYWWVKNSTWQTQKRIGRKPFTYTSDVSAVKTSKQALNFP